MKRYSEKSFSPEASDLNHAAYGEGVKSFKAGKFSNAARSFAEALEYWPLDPQAWFALGNCYDELGKASKAEGCFMKSLKYSSPEKKSDVYFNLGNSLFDQDKYAEAAAFYKKVSAQSTTYAVAQKNLMLVNRELQAGKT